MVNKILFLVTICLLAPGKILSFDYNVSDSTIIKYVDKLLLINKIPIGSVYTDVKKIFPDISELHKENPRSNLYSAKSDTHIFGHKCLIQFNFRGIGTSEVLYSYYYLIDSLDKSTAESLYQLLKNFYNEQFGNSREEKEMDPAGFYTIASIWKTRDFSAGVTNNFYFNFNILSWGFQKRIDYKSP